MYLLEDWNSFLDSEIAGLAGAAMSCLPSAGLMLGSGGGKPLVLNKPEDKADFMQFLSSTGAKDGG